jgi:hypothetical protein
LLFRATVVLISPILVTVIKEALSSSKTSVLTRATRRNTPEETILHSHRRGNLKYYIANVLSSPILVRLMMEAIRSSETSVLTRATWRNTPEEAILHSHRCENLKSYIANVLSSPILVRLMIDAIRSSETSVLTRATRRNIPEDGSLLIILGEEHK